MKIEPTYITFEQAKWLKEKHLFDIPCTMCYSDDDKRPMPFNAGNDYHINSKHPYYSVPKQWEIVEWLRINYGIWIEAFVDDNQTFGCMITKFNIEGRLDSPLFRNFNTPQEAYSAAFDYIRENELI